MAKLIVFGAGGRAGRLVVREAVARGHDVTAVVRDAARHADLRGDAVEVVAGDATHAESVADVARGHDRAISTIARLDVVPAEFYAAATRALVAGLGKAGVGRLVLAGIGTTLATEDGVPLYDTPDFPAEARDFSLGHAAELEILRTGAAAVDWVVLAPPPVFLDPDAAPSRRYRLGGGTLLPESANGGFSYADFASALVDEATDPTRHRELVAVGY